MADEIRPLVLMDGNCQGQALAAILHHSGLAEAYAVGGDLGFVPGYRGQACLYVDARQAPAMIGAAHDSGRRVVHGTQATPTSDGTVRSYSGEVDLVVRFPQLQFYAQSPGEFASHFGHERAPAQLFAFDLSTVKVCQARAGSTTDFAELMRTTGLHTPLYHSALHPGGLLTAHLVSDFARQLPGCDLQAIASLTDEIAAGEGINFINCHPVPVSRQAEFGADWQHPYPVYADLLAKTAQGDWAGVMAHAACAADLFPEDTQTWNALSLAAMATGDDDMAIAALDRLLDLSPGFNEFWRRAFDFCRRRGDAGFSDLAARAGAFFGTQRQGHSVLALALCERGQWTEAEAEARLYLERTPERYEGWLPLLTVLVRSGRDAEARAQAREVAHTCPANRAGEWQACLAQVPGIDWSPAHTLPTPG